MLDDLAWPARGLVAAFAAAVGVVLAVPVTDPSDGLGTALVVVGVALEVVVLAGWTVLRSRADRRFLAALAEATDDLARGRVEPVPAVGVVVRRRVADVPSWLPGRGSAPGPSDVVTLTALGDGPARRVAACVPGDLGLEGRGTPAVLLLHPGHREAAAVDDRVTHERLVAVAADPRWTQERLPSDRSVVGGVVGLLLAAVVGGAVGTGLGSLVVALAT